MDDGNYADNGNSAGAYNCDNPERTVVLGDGSFFVSTTYDEAGYPLRKFTSTGQSTMASNLADKEILAMGRSGDDLIAVIGKAAPKLARINARGERLPFATGALDLPIFAGGETVAAPLGLAIRGNLALVALPGLDVIRSIDVTTGNKVSDWPVPRVGDLSLDETGGLWAISGQEVALIALDGAISKKIATGLTAPAYLAVQNHRLAVVDRVAARLAYIDADNGQAIKTFGRDRPLGEWLATSPDLLRDPRGVAFLPDGRLLIAEAARLRSFWPDSGVIGHDILSNFMDSTVVHPVAKQYLYNFAGVFEVDPSTGAWNWKLEQPRIEFPDRDKAETATLGSPSQAVTLGGRPFVVYHSPDRYLLFFDVSDPLKPRLALSTPREQVPAWSYSTVTFGKDGALIVAPSVNQLQFLQYRFTGLDGSGNPQFDFANPTKLGPEKDAWAARDLKQVGAASADGHSGDVYFLAVTAMHNKMVPGWGADGTGVGKAAVDGTPRWFAQSSGGNYMSISTVNNGQQTLTLAAKSFGGQLDVFDTDGLRLTTGNWGWPTHYQIGFVDLRYGVHGYVRTDGAIGAYVEDDAIGRFARARVDGIESIKRAQTTVEWSNVGVVATSVPAVSDAPAGKSLTRASIIPRVTALPIDGNYKAWSDAGVHPQIVILPGSIGFGRVVPANLLADFREGTAIGAMAQDGQNLYVYFVATDVNPTFDADKSGSVWMFDGIELWLEEEQFGLSFTRDNTPVLHKFRHHDKAGKEWSANYLLPRENIWASRIDNLDEHPLARQLAGITGTSFVGKPGWAVCGKIPLDEIKLVGGAPGRVATQITNMTGQAGELMRVGVALGAVSAPGREQDYKVNWPAGLMFSDPTRSANFILGK